MTNHSYFLTNAIVLICLGILFSCGQGDKAEIKQPVEVVSPPKHIDLKIGSISIVRSGHEYIASTQIKNHGDTIASQYSVVIRWRCPTETKYIHDTPMPPSAPKPIKPGQTVTIRFSVPLGCQPRPIIIPCIFYLIEFPVVNSTEKIYDEKELDYTLNP